MGNILKLLVGVGLLAAAATVNAKDRSAVCDKPVDMVILSIVHDVERYQAYRSSLDELGTVEEFGGRVISVGTRLVADPEVLEGDWPDDRHAFVIRWPCAAAAHAFWTSETYQTKILPLRVGAGQFNIALFPAIPDTQ
jgi:uncharacterized protein (DUF1330 family)